jgi:hypothetical protein
MFQIDNSTATAEPARGAVGPNPGGFFNGGVPGTTPATDVDADWLNMVQSELAAILAAAGLAQNKTNDGQVIASLQALFAGVNGSTAKQFGVANATTANQAVALGQLFTPLYAAGSTTGASFTATISFTPAQNGKIFLNGNGASLVGNLSGFALSGSGYTALAGQGNYSPSSIGTMNYVLSVTAGVPVTLNVTVSSSSNGVIGCCGIGIYLPTV